MTVSYSHDVATGRGFGNFGPLLFRWKGSIYRMLLPDLVIYMILYFSVSLIYRFGIQSLHSKVIFEKLVRYCSEASTSIPISFVLGFYVSQIVVRWWSQFMAIPWPDSLCMIIATAIQGTDERSRLLRRTIMRYVNLSLVMIMSTISPQAHARFPTLDHLVEAGILMDHEKVILQELDHKFTLQQIDPSKYFIPLVWAGTLVAKARKENKIKDDMIQSLIISHLSKWRANLGSLLCYDWVNIPIVYTQVVTIAVYLYFLTAIIGKQFIDSEKELDLLIPVFLFLEFFFYVGWLKVAEAMINPFGEDDDDFEVNWIIDRSIIVSYLIVDEMHSEVPELLKDAYWDVVFPDELPYTEASAKFKTTEPPMGSALKMDPMAIFNQTKPLAEFDNYVSQSGSMENQDSPILIDIDSSDENTQRVRNKSYAHLLEKDIDETESKPEVRDDDDMSIRKTPAKERPRKQITK